MKKKNKQEGEFVQKVRETLHGAPFHGQATLRQLLDGTGLAQADITNAVEELKDLGEVRMIGNMVFRNQRPRDEKTHPRDDEE